MSQLLRQYRWHTGADLEPVMLDEPIPPLVRDLGLDGMNLFLQRGLNRLAGPMTPLTYMRTAHYEEPYIDHGKIGRLLILSPREIEPWHSGVPEIYVADATNIAQPESLVFYPPHLPLVDVPKYVNGARNRNEFRESMGDGDYDDIVEDAKLRVRKLFDEAEENDRVLVKIRRDFQNGCREIRDFLEEAELDESDLCTAWHHLPEERRDRLKHVTV